MSNRKLVISIQIWSNIGDLNEILRPLGWKLTGMMFDTIRDAHENVIGFNYTRRSHFDLEFHDAGLAAKFMAMHEKVLKEKAGV